MSTTALEMRVKRDDFAAFETVKVDTPEPGDGQALLKVNKFAFTANNITYAVAGDMLSYWGLFAAPEGWGRIPVWGFAEVLASRVDGLEPGERLYGYLPMSTHVLTQPEQLSSSSFFDRNPARQGPHDIYHQYLRCAADPAYDKDYEAEQALFRPLFTTSFVIDDFCVQSDFFGAKQIILGSASSKTAIGAAYLLARRENRDYTVVGLTSAGNKSFVEGLGHYDEVVTYDDIETLSDKDSVLIDMSGSADVMGRVHHKFGDKLKKSSIVGITHYEERGETADFPGPKPEMFFAPSLIAERTADWGPAKFQALLGEAWDSFLKPRLDWLTLIESQGEIAVTRAYHRIRKGEAHPSEGHMMTLWEE